MSDDDAFDEVFARFVRDHPEHVNSRKKVELPDGRTETMMTDDAAIQFVRWSLINGEGDPQACLDFLTEGVPAMNRTFDALERKAGGVS